MTHTSTQQPDALNLEEFRAKVTHAAREPLLARIAELEAQLAAAQQGLGVKVIDLIEKAGDVRLSRCRLGSIKGPIRWDVEFGCDDIEVRGKTLQEVIVKALAAQVKLNVK